MKNYHHRYLEEQEKNKIRPLVLFIIRNDKFFNIILSKGRYSLIVWILTIVLLTMISIIYIVYICKESLFNITFVALSGIITTQLFFVPLHVYAHGLFFEYDEFLNWTPRTLAKMGVLEWFAWMHHHKDTEWFDLLSYSGKDSHCPVDDFLTKIPTLVSCRNL